MFRSPPATRATGSDFDPLIQRGRRASGASSSEPIVQGVIVDADEENSCSVCLSDLSLASQFRLPDCGHTFHALCLAAVLQHTLLCPLCRRPVAERTCREIAVVLVNEASEGRGTTLGAELLAEPGGMGVRKRAKRVGHDFDVSATVMVDTLKRAARECDATKVPLIASLLGHGSSPGESQFPREVRIAALEALRYIAPRVKSTWPGNPYGLELVQTCCTLDPDTEVRCIALQTLRDISPHGLQSSLAAVREVLRDTFVADEVHVSAADALQSLAVIHDHSSIATAMAAFANKELSVRSTAMRTLRHICPRGECGEVVHELSALLTGPQQGGLDAEHKRNTLELLSELEEPGGQKGLGAAQACLEDPDEVVQESAFRTFLGLAMRGDVRAVATLAAVASDTDHSTSYLRCQACVALPRVAMRDDDTAVQAIAVCIGDEDTSVRSAAASALKELCHRGNERATEASQRQLQAGDDETQRLCVEVLGYVAAKGHPSVISTLRQLRDSAPDEVRMAAEQALLQLS
mmetsp:Transcript_52011/g.123841  ORF Transcript_52011/g.123841 Transcript_52011/m.123841 type:complete len:522 (-) Transcript_52011:17-1582(-)